MPLEIILLIVFSCLTLVEVTYYFLVLTTFKKSKNRVSEQVPVSVIIANRNHGEELKQNLVSFLEQDYHEYEVILVDDFSTDDSRKIIYKLAQHYNHLKPVFLSSLKDDHVGKKDAITTGIFFAKNQLLLFSDADCKTVSKNWITEMVANYSPNTEIVLGYGKYEKTGGFLNKIIRFDAFIIAVKYLTFAKKGLAYMGVGRNLSYKKSLFLSKKGFYKHLDMDSGDDDLFVNKNSTRKNTSIALNKESFTVSSAKTSLFDWMKQKTRHITTSKRYSFKYKFLLGFFALCKYFWYFSFLALMLYTGMISPNHLILKIGLGIFIMTILVQFLVLNKAAKMLEERDLPLFSIVFECLLLFIYPIFILGKPFIKHNRI